METDTQRQRDTEKGIKNNAHKSNIKNEGKSSGDRITASKKT